MILWDDGKNQKLRLERNISFDQIAELILKKEYLTMSGTSFKAKSADICAAAEWIRPCSSLCH
jgi:hypothetical protein